MKKFIVFVMILIVTVSLGVTVYFFSQDREELIANVSAEMYVNQGDQVKFDVELKHGKANHNISIKSLNEDILNPDGDVLEFGFETKNGGACVVEISVENSKNIEPIYVTVYVGNGNPSTPFYIDSEETLKEVASSNMPSSSYYLLLNDISLTESFTPLDKFSGNFNGNGYTISNLNITTGNPENPSKAGLFSEITSTGSVSNLKVSGVNINGQFENAGTIAGVNNGTITRVSVEDGLVTSNLEENANVGGICGLVKYNNTQVGRVDRCNSALNICGYNNVGGLVGKNEGGIIINSYATFLDSTTDAVLAMADGANAGGVVGLNTYSDIYVSTVKNCYANISVVKAENLDASAEVKLGGVIGLNKDVDANKLNQLMGNYFNDGFITTGVNHIYSASVNATGAINYRGVNPFQKDAQGKVIKDTLLSYHGKTIDKETGSEVVDVPVYWDFENVWLISASANDGYPTLNANGADVPDDIAFLYDPNKIEDASDLYDFANKVNNGALSIEHQNYFLTADLDLSGDFTPIGTKENPFTGVFDGGNHTITGLLVNGGTTTHTYAGLFGYLSATAQIKNVKIVDPTINEGSTYVGAIAGYSEGALISNCSVKDTTNSTELNMVGYRSVGGIVGVNQGIVEKCTVENMTIAVKKNGVPATDYLKYRYVGGIAGENGFINSDKYATIRDCDVLNSIIYDDYGTANGYEKENYVVVSVFDNRNLYVHIGGICGTNNYKVYWNKVDNCKLTGDETDHRSMVGGIVALSKTLLRGKTEAEVYYNAVYESEIKGFTAAGVIGATCGLVKENACIGGDGGVVSGFVASGLVSDIRFGGKVIDCVTGTKVQNVPNKKHSYAAGLFNTSDFERGNLDYSNQGELYNCFSYCTFDAGQYENNYYDSCSKYKFIGDGWFDAIEARSRFCGEANQLIFVTTPNAKAQDYTFLGVTNLNDVSGITEELARMNVTELVALMESYNFNVSVSGDTSTWIVEMDVYPTLRNIPKKIIEKGIDK